MSRFPYRLAVLCIACLCGAARPAVAHDVRFGRLVHVRLLAEGAEVAMVVQLHAGPDALRVRQRFDANGDDQLDGDEFVAMRDWFEAEAFRDFALTVGGDPVALDPFEVALDLVGDAGVIRGEELLFRCVRRGTFVLRPGARTVAVRDAPANRREEIALRVDLPPPLPLERSRADGTQLVPLGAGSYRALLSAQPGKLTLSVVAPRRW